MEDNKDKEIIREDSSQHLPTKEEMIEHIYKTIPRVGGGLFESHVIRWLIDKYLCEYCGTGKHQLGSGLGYSPCPDCDGVRTLIPGGYTIEDVRGYYKEKRKSVKSQSDELIECLYYIVSNP